jgi:hypothetical protein
MDLTDSLVNLVQHLQQGPNLPGFKRVPMGSDVLASGADSTYHCPSRSLGISCILRCRNDHRRSSHIFGPTSKIADF